MVHTHARTVLLLCSLTFFAPSFANGIDGSCMASFNVQDKTFSNGIAILNCRVLESRRLDLFKQVDALPSSGNLDVAATTAQLAQLESKLKAKEDSTDWTGWAANITGNAIATWGLSACAETTGAGCAVAVISKVLSVLGIVKSGVSDADKAQEVRRWRNSIAAIRTKLTGTVTASSALRDRMVDEANQICTQVKTSCL